MPDVLGHDIILKVIESGTSWENEVNLSVTHSLDAGHIAYNLLAERPACCH